MPEPSPTPVTEHSLGDAAAPVVVVEFGDFECPFCADAMPVLHRLVAESDGQVRQVFRHFPLFDVHPYALTAALAAEAAADQGAFWPMHDLLFTHQDRLRDKDLAGYAEQLGVDPATVTGDAAQGYGDRVEADYAAGLALGVQGTPTLFLNGVPYRGKVTLDGLREAIAELGSLRR